MLDTDSPLTAVRALIRVPLVCRFVRSRSQLLVTVVPLAQVVAHVLFTARQNVLRQKRHQPNVLHVSIRQLAETETHYKNDNSFLISARGKVLRSFMTRANINAPT